MRRSRFRGRRLAPALLAMLAGLNLAGCIDAGETTDRVAAQAQAVDPPQLWRAEALDRQGAVQKAVLVCADRVLRDGLARANAEVNGETCVAEGPLISRPGQYALHCTVGGRRFAVWTRSWGDPANDLTVSFALNELGGGRQGVAQVRHYRRLGPCPHGWTVGQTAGAG